MYWKGSVYCHGQHTNMALPRLHDGATPNLGGSHGRAVGILSGAVGGRGHSVAAQWAPKSGKTTILAATIAELASEPIRFIKLSNPNGTTLEQRDLGSRLIGTPIDGPCLHIVAAVTAGLADVANGMRFVIAVDDAHTLSDRAMELLLRVASPVRGSRTPQLILVGEEDFWSRPWRDEWRIIVSMAEHVALAPLAGADTRDFVAFELARSGGAVTEVTDDAVARIVRRSRGLPARVNEIVAACLSIAQCRAAPILSDEVVEAAIATIAQPPTLASKPRSSALSLSAPGDAEAPVDPADSFAPSDTGEGDRSPGEASPDRVLPIISGDRADPSESHPPEQTVRAIKASTYKLDEAGAARPAPARPGAHSNFDAKTQRPERPTRPPRHPQQVSLHF